MTRCLQFAAIVLFTGIPYGLADEVIDLGSRRELFVDDHLIAVQTGDVGLVVQKPRAEEVVLVTNEPWEGNTCAYYTIFEDDGLYRMYYRGSHANEKTLKATHREVTCYAESRDGIHWTKPNLGIHEWEGSTDNNIVLDGLGTHCFVAFKDENPDAPANARYKGISVGKTGGVRGLFVFQSADAVHWELMQDKPVITKGAFDSQNLAFWDSERGLYTDYHRIFTNGVRSIMRATSDDFVHWTEPVLLSYEDSPNEHLYTNAIRVYDRAPHIWIGFPTRFTPSNNQVEPLFMSSRDGLKFRRSKDAVIPSSAPADRDGNRSNYMANGLVSLPGNDRELAVYATEAYYVGPDSRLRRFMYRVDGFVALHFGPKGGEVITPPLTFSGSELRLNYKSAKTGELRVEMCEADGTPIPAFSTSACKSQAGDQVDGMVTWTDQPDLAMLAGKPVTLKIIGRDTDVFAFRFAE